MPPLLEDCLPFLPLALLPALFLLLAPLCGRGGRTVLGIVLLLLGLGFVVDVLVIDHTMPVQLDVPNVLPRGPEAKAHIWIVEPGVQGRAWHWHIVTAAWLALLGAVLLLRRGREPKAPQPVVHVAGVFLLYLLLRIGLEKTAGPLPIVWSVGVAFASALAMPFFGWYAGRRGTKFGGFVVQLLLFGLVTRLVVTVLAYFATTRMLGSHLDTHLVTDIHLKGLYDVKFAEGDRFAAWLYPTAIPQMTFGILFFALAPGLVLGSLPFWLARRK